MLPTRELSGVPGDPSKVRIVSLGQPQNIS